MVTWHPPFYGSFFILKTKKPSYQRYKGYQRGREDSNSRPFGP